MSKSQLLSFLVNIGAAKVPDVFTTRNSQHGANSHYLNLNAVNGRPDILSLAARCIMDERTIVPASITHLCCLEAAEVPFLSAFLLHRNGSYMRMFSPSTDLNLGTIPTPGVEVLLFRGVISHGDSTLQTVKSLHNLGLRVQRVVSLLTRSPQATENFLNQGIVLVSLFTSADFE